MSIYYISPYFCKSLLQYQYLFMIQINLIKITNNISIYEGQELGFGRYGRVFKGYCAESRANIAVKIISKDIISQYQLLFDREVQVLIKLNKQKELIHNNVVKFFGSAKKNGQGYLFFEICEDNLQNKLQFPLNQRTVTEYFKEMIEGLAFLHSKDIIHRDLKPQNILFNFNKTIKIADFGLSKEMNTSQTLKMTEKVGNFAYQAPQVQTKQYDSRSDVWSLGLILYQLLTGTLCREYAIESSIGIERRNKDIQQGNFNIKFEGYQPIWEQLLSKMLVYDYRKRATSQEIMDEYIKWFQQYFAGPTTVVQQQEPVRLFKTFAQFENNIGQMKKTMNGLKATSRRSQKDQNKPQSETSQKQPKNEQQNSQPQQEKPQLKLQQRPQQNLQKQQPQTPPTSQQTQIIQSLKDESHESLLNYIEYLDYYHLHKRISETIEFNLLNIVKNNPNLKQIYNSFIILTSSFFMEIIVYLRYSQLLTEMDQLLTNHPNLQNQYTTIQPSKQNQFNQVVAQKKQKFTKFINVTKNLCHDKIKKRMQYRQKLDLNENYIKCFNFLNNLNLKKVTFQQTLHHLKLLLLNVQLNVEQRSTFWKLTNQQLKIIYLLKKLRQTCEQMGGSFHMKTSDQLKEVLAEVKALSMESVRQYLLDNPS